MDSVEVTERRRRTSRGQKAVIVRTMIGQGERNMGNIMLAADCSYALVQQTAKALRVNMIPFTKQARIAVEEARAPFFAPMEIVKAIASPAGLAVLESKEDRTRRELAKQLEGTYERLRRIWGDIG